MPQRGAPRLGPRLENAGPAIAQEHLVFLGRAVRGVPHRAPAESAAARADAEVLDKRRGKRLNGRYAFFVGISTGSRQQPVTDNNRSEERRVGKECRARW